MPPRPATSRSDLSCNNLEFLCRNFSNPSRLNRLTPDLISFRGGRRGEVTAVKFEARHI